MNESRAVSSRSLPWKTRAALYLTGHVGKQVETFLVDTVIYGAVVTYCTNRFGVWYGGFYAFSIMTPITILLCRLYLAAYDKLQWDIFGFEALKEFREERMGAGRISRLFYTLVEKSDVLAFILLSVFSDAFQTTVYLRKGSYNGMSKRDWTIFWGSIALSNAYWTARWSVIIQAILYVFHLLPEHMQAMAIESLLWVRTLTPF